jgi:hypothetical protein
MLKFFLSLFILVAIGLGMLMISNVTLIFAMLVLGLSIIVVMSE